MKAQKIIWQETTWHMDGTFSAVVTLVDSFANQLQAEENAAEFECQGASIKVELVDGDVYVTIAGIDLTLGHAMDAFFEALQDTE